jgi:hypothetical protein
MSFLDDLRECLKRERQATKPYSLSYVLRKRTGCRNIYMSDKRLDLLTKQEVTEFLRIDQEDKREYVHESWDCDDFARSLYCNAKSYFIYTHKKNAAFGLLWTRRYAFCFFVDNDLDIYYIEPQNDQYIDLPSKPLFMIL